MVVKGLKLLVERFSIVNFPTLVVITDSGVVKYDGPLKHKEIHEFLLKYSEKRTADGTAAAANSDSTKVCSQIYTSKF